MYNLTRDRIKFIKTRSIKIKTRSDFFRNPFFPSTINKWNKLDRDICNSDSLNVFKFSLLKFVRPVASSIFEINNPYDLKLLIRLRLGLSHLRYHKLDIIFKTALTQYVPLV